MRTIVSLFTSLALLFLVPSALRGEEKAGPQVKLKLDKGASVEYLVKREGSTSGESSQGEFKSKDESEVSYRLEVAEQKDGGDLVLKVTLPKARARFEGRNDTLEFDSTRPDSGGEVGSQLREVLSKTLTVTVRDGAIKEISGLPEPPSADGGGGQGRSFQARRFLGRERLRRDLGLILASGVQGKTLEKGKEYVSETREERDTGGQEKGRRGFFRGAGDGPLNLKYDGEETVGAKKAARFKVEPRKPESTGGGNTPEVKGEGKALVSVEDGLLLTLELQSSSKTEGERQGNSFKFNREQKVHIERKEGGSEKPKAKADV